MVLTSKSSLEDNSKATDDMKSLPEDVIILILVTLPVKTLMRFRCVCKSWYDLIRSPKFIEMHSISTKHKKNECILIHRLNTYPDTVFSFLSYDESLNVISPNLEIPPLNFGIFKVSNPCNGLLLLVSNDAKTLIICNPATREFKYILPPPNPFPYSDSDPLVYKFGLGFDSKKDEYKAFVEVCDGDNNGYEKSFVYNMRTDSWRQINPPVTAETANRYRMATQGLLYNGALHWVVRRDNIDYDIILCFDVSTEVFQDIKLPQGIRQSYKINKNVTIVNDCLALFTFTYMCYPSKYVDMWVMNIWVMKEYGVEGSWIKQFSVSGIPNTFSSWYPYLMWKNEAILIETKTKEEERKLVLCALDTHNMTDTRLMNDDYIHRVMVYKESLVSLK